MPKATKNAPAPYDWGQEEHTGFENTNSADFGIPFLQVIQKGSPEYDEEHKDHEKKAIEGIKPGMVINSLTREILYDKEAPLQFIPCYAEKMYPEFRPRKEGGGYCGMHTSEILSRCSRNDKNKDVIVSGPGEGNEIITTHYFFGFALDNSGEWVRAVIGMTSTQLKNARRWLNMMSSIKQNGRSLPMFSHIYNLTTVVESNSEGSWFGWDMSVNRMINPNDKDDLRLVQEARTVVTDQLSTSMLKLTDSQSEEEPF